MKKRDIERVVNNERDVPKDRDNALAVRWSSEKENVITQAMSLGLVFIWSLQRMRH